MDEIIRQACYPFRFEKLVEDLGKEKENLQTQRHSVQDRVTKAQQDAQKIDILAMKWMDKADALIGEANLLEEKAEMKSFCPGLCPNLIGRCHLAKEIEKKIKEIVDQGSKCNCPQLARPASPPSIGYFISEDFMWFGSTKLAYDQLLVALKDDEVSLVGLYGMGGCGKTTLAQQVGKSLEEHFRRVVFVAISGSVDIPKIQDSIASELGVELKGQGDQGKAKNLWSKLSNAGNILIILDDVWEFLDFKAIGIPSNFKGCKVLLTTRSQHVCTLMDCQSTVHLQLMQDQEAWRLFQHYARFTSLTPDRMKDLAEEIAHECKGLAIAIATVASTLKGKILAEWEEALVTLRDSKWVNIEDGLRDPYKCLMLSYEKLKDECAKSVFLLCSTFPKDSKIHEEDLVRYGIGLGLFERFIPFERSRNQLSVAKHKLIGSCLLMKTNDGQCVKMHDLVRDVALWIAKEEHREIASGQRIEEVMKAYGHMEGNKIRYLWLDEVKLFPSPLHFPNLVFLRVELGKDSFIRGDCFKELLGLKVLVLKCKNYGGRRQIIQFLDLPTNLHCLHLEGLELGNMSFIGSLKKLQSVTIGSCSFNSLPNEILELESLKLLDVRQCEIKENPYEVMGKCSKLEELYFKGNDGQWVDEQEHACDIFGTKSDFPKLQRYGIEIGSGWLFYIGDDFWTSVRSIAVEHFDVFTTNETIKELVRRAESLCLKKIHGGGKNVIPEVIQRIGRKEDLTRLELHDSEDLEFFVDFANRESVQFENIFSKLTDLQIQEMKSLKAFYGGTCPKAHEVLNMSNLKVFRLSSCPSLTHVFTFAIAQSLAVLEVLEVKGCDGLKHIVTDDEMQHSQQRSNLVFQKLRWLSVSGCNQIEYLITIRHNEFQSIELATLKELHLVYLPNLISIFSENYYARCSSLTYFDLIGCTRFNMKTLNDVVVGRAGSQELGSIVSDSTQKSNEAILLQTLQNVQFINVEDSSHIENVFQLTRLPSNGESTLLELKLRFLILSQLSELKYICEGPTRCISLQNLASIVIIGCKELRSIFTVSIVRDLHHLWLIKIVSCDKLEQIIEGEDSMDNFEITSHSSTPPLYGSQNIGSFNLCHLQELEVRDCAMLKWLFTLSTAKTLTSLQYLEIEGCEELEYVIKDERFEANKSAEAIVDDDGQAILPKLIILHLIDLPNLMEVYCGFQFQSTKYDYLEVKNCPKLIPQPPVEGALTASEDENEDSEEDKAVEEEDKLVPYDLNKAGENIILEPENQLEREFSLPRTSNLSTEAGPSVEGTETASKDENEEVKKDTVEDKAIDEENKFVLYDVKKAGKNIILESENQ